MAIMLARSSPEAVLLNINDSRSIFVAVIEDTAALRRLPQTSRLNPTSVTHTVTAALLPCRISGELAPETIANNLTA